jgi:PhnB protein
MTVQAYLFFNGRCEEAINYYQRALGAKVEMLMRFKEAPESPPPGMVPPGWDNKVMHSCLRIGDTAVMASDGCGGDKQGFQGFSLSITAADEAQADRTFKALADGGEVTMPLGKTFFAKQFGTVTDRFGVSWMLIVPAEGQAP